MMGDVPGFFVGSFKDDGAITLVHDLRADRKTTLPLSRLREAHEGWLPSYMNAVD